MSLTSHLRDSNSPIGQFIRQRFSQSPRITRIANPQLRGARTINPGFASSIYGHLGMAIDYRIRYYFALTPKEHLVAWYGTPKIVLKPWDNANDSTVNSRAVPTGMNN